VQGVAFFHTAGARQVRGRQSKIARVPTTHDSAKHNKLFSIMLKTLLIAIFSFLALVTVRSRRKVMESIYKELYEAEPDIGVPASSKRVVRLLQKALASCILLRSNADAFNASASNYFAQQSNTTRPACIVRPETVKQLSLAVAILHQEFLARRADAHDKHNNLGFVSLRSGGHSYARASASIDGGVLLDLSRFSDVTISEDESSVTVGTGARWSKVNQVLEAKKIAVPGGRNAAVGVGGFTLGGKLCFKVRLGLLSQYTDTKLHRRYFILLTEIWISLLERHQVRGSIGFWTGGHCFRNKQPRTLACA
jgi:hypothetical protein